jgi:hypothetical protein
MKEYGPHEGPGKTKQKSSQSSQPRTVDGRRWPVTPIGMSRGNVTWATGPEKPPKGSAFLRKTEQMEERIRVLLISYEILRKHGGTSLAEREGVLEPTP